MKKLLLCLVVGLSAAMLFAADITSEIESGTWSNEGSEFIVKFDATSEDLSYIKVGFSSKAVSDSTDTTADNFDRKDVTLAKSTEDSTRFDNSASGSDVYVYYQVRTSSPLKISLSTEALKMTDMADIPFYIDVTPKTDSAEGSKTTIANGTQATPILVMSAADGGLKKASDCVKLDIYTTLSDIPSSATDGGNQYEGKIKLEVSTNA